MKMATVRTAEQATRAVRVDDGRLVDLGSDTLEEVLSRPGWRAQVEQADTPYVAEAVAYAPVVTRPGKIVCVGLNYRNHILEMGRKLPEFPTLFAKYAESLIGAEDAIVLPPESGAVDWEAELAVVIGDHVRRATTQQASDAIAGFAVLNDVTMRDWQYRSPMWLQGKTWEATTPLGPHLVTPDELPGGTTPALSLVGEVNGEVVQKADTADLVFDPVRLVEYISTMITLQPGDVIATGTPGGVGHARKPARYLQNGDVLTTTITGLGSSTCHAVEAAV
ncbi:fumarylacetoacetate hydrolase family protein [Flexivirga meconopsidis]|uniref:fumarylacetoacetate hydrolase family protein n=1 Tax=Flexivirga meconopsidis TaxID=2977121 RepID=UPI00223FE6DF|nr:fumarylacetoacetate hydrolase family protein [Flexivirga meconopsidis]